MIRGDTFIIEVSITKMEDFRKGAHKKHIHTRTAIIILVPVFFLLVYSIISVSGKSIETIKKNNDAHAILSNLESRRDKLSIEINKLHTDAGVEEVLRDKYRAVKEGEGVVVIVDEKEKITDVEYLSDKSFWKTIKKWFSRD